MADGVVMLHAAQAHVDEEEDQDRDRDPDPEVPPVAAYESRRDARGEEHQDREVRDGEAELRQVEQGGDAGSIALAAQLEGREG